MKFEWELDSNYLQLLNLDISLLRYISHSQMTEKVNESVKSNRMMDVKIWMNE